MTDQKHHDNTEPQIYKNILLSFVCLFACFWIGTTVCVSKSMKQINVSSQERQINPSDYMTAVNDTFQIGRYVVGISLPERSKILIGKNEKYYEGLQAGAIRLDSTGFSNMIIITCNEYWGTSDFESNNGDDLIKVDTLPNTYAIRVLKTEDRYNVRAVSPNYGISFETDVDSLVCADSVIKIYETIRILPMRKYDNTKSDRPKGVINVRLE